MSGKSALLLGATGAVGKHVLRELVASNEFSRVGEYGRRATPLDQLASNARDKLVQKTIDFENLDASGLRDSKWDVVFITLGTTRAAAGGAKAFEKIDRDYVVNAARAVKVEGHPQRLVYVSANGANANSPFLYPKSKGLTENQLAELNYSDTIIFRPAFLANAERPSKRFAESLAGPIVGLLSRILPVQIDVSQLGKAVVRAGFLGSDKLPPEAKATQAQTPTAAKFTLIGNTGAENLAKATL